MSTSALNRQTAAARMPSVRIQMEASLVPVMRGLKEMEQLVMVGTRSIMTLPSSSLTRGRCE